MIMFSVVRNICETNKNDESEQKLWLWVHSLFRRIMFTTSVLQWCIDLVDSDLVDCRDFVDYFCCLTDDRNGQIMLGKSQNSRECALRL